MRIHMQIMRFGLDSSVDHRLNAICQLMLVEIAVDELLFEIVEVVWEWFGGMVDYGHLFHPLPVPFDRYTEQKTNANYEQRKRKREQH